MILFAVGAPPLVADLGIVLVATAFFGYLAQRLGLVAIVGYLVAGVVIGPFALGWITQRDRRWRATFVVENVIGLQRHGLRDIGARGLA